MQLLAFETGGIKRCERQKGAPAVSRLSACDPKGLAGFSWPPASLDLIWKFRAIAHNAAVHKDALELHLLVNRAPSALFSSRALIPPLCPRLFVEGLPLHSGSARN